MATRASLRVLGLLVLLSAGVALGAWKTFDLTSMRAMSRWGNHTLDCWIAYYSYLGSPEISLVLAGLLCFWLWKRQSWEAAGAFVGALGIISLLEILGKMIVHQPPPPSEFGRHCAHAEGLHQLYMPTPFSYPSGHTLRFTFLFVFLARLVAEAAPFKRLVWALAWALIALMAVTRVYTGDHWASDVAGGLLLAWLGYLWVPLRSER